MIALLWFVLAILASPFNRKAGLKHRMRRSNDQLIVLRRKVNGRVRLTNNDRLFFVQLYRWFPSIRHDALRFVHRLNGGGQLLLIGKMQLKQFLSIL